MPPHQPVPTASLSAGGRRPTLSRIVLGACLALVLTHDGWAMEPSNALRPCPRFGNGFWAIAGTDTCLRIEGAVGTDVFAHGSHVKDARFDGDPFVIAGRPTRKDRLSFETAAGVSFDTRTATEFGSLRTSLELDTDLGDERPSAPVDHSTDAGRGRESVVRNLQLDTARWGLAASRQATGSFFASTTRSLSSGPYRRLRR